MVITLIPTLPFKLLKDRRWIIYAGVASLLGGLWLYQGVGIFFAPCLIPVVKKGATGWQRFLIAWCYFAMGSCGILDAYSVFFIHGTLWQGILCWCVSATLLAFPWWFYRRFVHLLLILLLEALPPLGCIGWLSPLHSFGWWFPGLGLMTMLLGIVSSLVLHSPRRYGVITLTLIAVISEGLYELPLTPPGWLAIDTQLPPLQYSTTNSFEEMKRLQPYLNTSSDIQVLPETVLSNWFYGSRKAAENLWPHQGLILVGVSHWHNGSEEDGITIIDHGKASDNLLFESVFPTPIAMWHPWSKDSYRAHWWPKSQIIEHSRVNAIICYDQLLVWPWLSLFITHPAIILAPSNEWWASSSSIPAIQEKCRQSWARVFHVPLISARNLALSQK